MIKDKLNNKVIWLIVVIVVILIVVFFVWFFSKKEMIGNGDDVTDNTIIQEVSPSEADNMYQSLIQNCTGALVWDLKVGDEIQIDNLESMSACQNDNHYSKMIGYTYDESGNVIIHVNVLKNVNNQLYTMDDILVGDFSEDEIDQLLEQGTTYEYFYKKNGDGYKLFKVDLMD